jgi:hypothetical protein
MAPGRGPVKIAAALTIAAAGFGGSFAYKRFRRYLDNKKRRKQKTTSAARKRSVTRKRPRTRKKSTTKSKRKPAEPTTSQGSS